MFKALQRRSQCLELLSLSCLAHEHLTEAKQFLKKPKEKFDLQNPHFVVTTSYGELKC